MWLQPRMGAAAPICGQLMPRLLLMAVEAAAGVKMLRFQWRQLLHPA
jgi:hypothetical protein